MSSPMTKSANACYPATFDCSGMSLTSEWGVYDNADGSGKEIVGVITTKSNLDLTEGTYPNELTFGIWFKDTLKE